MHKELSIEEFLKKEGYLDVRFLPGQGWCGIEELYCTWALWCGMDLQAKGAVYHFRRYCEAFMALAQWDGTGDPPGPWIKYKSVFGERTNPQHPSYFKP